MEDITKATLPHKMHQRSVRMHTNGRRHFLLSKHVWQQWHVAFSGTHLRISRAVDELHRDPGTCLHGCVPWANGINEALVDAPYFVPFLEGHILGSTLHKVWKMISETFLALQQKVPSKMQEGWIMRRGIRHFSRPQKCRTQITHLFEFRHLPAWGFKHKQVIPCS